MVEIRAGSQAWATWAATLASAARISTMFGLCNNVSERPNRCSLWNLAPATIIAPPNVEETNSIAASGKLMS